MVAAGVDFVGDDYVEYIEPFASAFQACFLNDDWFTCCRVDKRFSLGTYRAWRQGNAGCDVCLECQMFVCGIRVSQNVRRHPVFKRIITIALTNVAWVNDIFGAGKDFSSAGNHPDNEIVFRVVEKGESIQDVVDNMCLLIEEELHDLIYMKQTLVDIFGEDESIRCFLEMVDVQIDGQLMVYMENTRYKCNRGYVRIFRDADEKGKIETVPSG
ncbi:(3S,6E)-nerolidol synthase-like isoform X1 [Folsomia candida]|nr:(3S,6E)-nerolidol synthase-like isoform X1 [Folsomia candida]